MNQSDLPTRFNYAFAYAAGGSYIRSIPDAHQTASGSDAPASLYDGFPPECFSPIGSGGIPPNGKDFNGILNRVTAWARWQAAGGPAIYNSAFSTAIGGYPKGARLASTSIPGATWVSTVDNNTTNPDGGSPSGWLVDRATGAGWFKVGDTIVQYGSVSQSTSSGEQSVTFPIAFPTSCLWAIAANGASGPPTAFHGVGNMTRTGMSVYSSTASGVAAPAGVAAWWAAIGK